MASAPTPSPSSSRQRSVILVVIGVLTLGLVNIVRAVSLYRLSDLQLELGVSLDPRLRMILSIIWAAILIASAIVIWMRKPRTRIVVPVILAVYAIYRLAIIGIYAQSEYARSNQLVTVVLYSGVILFAVWALNRRASRKYFTEDLEGRKTDSRPSASST